MNEFFPDQPALEAEYLKAAQTILCDCGCHPQSVHDCACGRAEQMRAEIAARVRDLKSGDAVIADYVAKYGEKIRVAPTADGFNLVAWVGPGIGFLAGAVLLAALLRRWRRSVPAHPAAAPAGAGIDDASRARLDRALEDFDR